LGDEKWITFCINALHVFDNKKHTTIKTLQNMFINFNNKKHKKTFFTSMGLGCSNMGVSVVGEN